MHVASHPEAEQELEAAALWYEERQPGLGDDFLGEFERALRRIEAEVVGQGGRGAADKMSTCSESGENAKV
jgi:hypothetical protein